MNLETDLHMTNEGLIDVGNLVANIHVDPYEDTSHATKRFIIPVTGWTLQPLRRVLLSTIETVTIPKDYAGLIKTRSTYARHGILSATTFADPGFEGTLTMEIFNSSANYIILRPGDMIWTILMVKLLEGSLPMYEGRYKGQRELQPAKVLDPSERKWGMWGAA